MFSTSVLLHVTLWGWFPHCGLACPKLHSLEVCIIHSTYLVMKFGIYLYFLNHKTASFQESIFDVKLAWEVLASYMAISIPLLFNTYFWSYLIHIPSCCPRCFHCCLGMLYYIYYVLGECIRNCLAFSYSPLVCY